MLALLEQGSAFQRSMQKPEMYIMTIQSGDDRISQGFAALTDAEARTKAAEILALETRRVGRTAVVTLTRLDGTPVVSPRSRS